MHLEKNQTYASTFAVQPKEINVFKVRFTMMYSSRKLNNNKFITTACNCCRQIACPFQFYVGTNHHDNFCAKSIRKTLFWISRFFHQTNSDVTNCFCRQFFRPFYEDKGQKIVISNCKYLRDACFNWAEIHRIFMPYSPDFHGQN